MSTMMLRRRGVGAVRRGGYDILTAVAWQSAFWAEDPGWTNPGDGNPVTSWRNAGSDGTAATEATNTPLYRAAVAALNGKPAVDFDGTNDLLTANIADVANPFTIVAICHHDDSGTDCVVGLGTNGLIWNAAIWRLGSATNNVVSSTNPDTCLLVGFSDGASSTLEANGAVTGAVAGAGSNASATELRIGNRASALPFNGQIAFVGLKSAALTAPELAGIEAWAASHYGLTIT